MGTPMVNTPEKRGEKRTSIWREKKGKSSGKRNHEEKEEKTSRICKGKELMGRGKGEGGYKRRRKEGERTPSKIKNLRRVRREGWHGPNISMAKKKYLFNPRGERKESRLPKRTMEERKKAKHRTMSGRRKEFSRKRKRKTPSPALEGKRKLLENHWEGVVSQTEEKGKRQKLKNKTG